MAASRLRRERFFPEDLGVTVNELLVSHFPGYVDYQFTAHLEEELDEIARGEISWKPVVRNFWKPFISLIDQKDAEIKKNDIITEKTDELCPQCGKILVIRLGRYGKFLGCEGYPQCTYIRSCATKEGEGSEQGAQGDEHCEKCGKPMVIKEGRYGRFLACSGYPGCKSVKSLNKSVLVGVKCPVCAEGDVVEKKTRRNRIFYGCSQYPQCSFATWDNGKYKGDAWYGYIVHQGAKPHMIPFKGRKAAKRHTLWWPGAAHPIAKVKHPGMKGVPYLKTGWESSHAAALGRFVQRLRVGIAQEARKRR